MAQAPVVGVLKETVRQVYTVTKSACDSFTSAVAHVSVGNRIQGNQLTEVIITQTAHSMSTMRGLQARHDFTIDIIAFDKSYTKACGLSDHIMGYISARSVEDGFANQYKFFPKSQIMYYTDEDDYAVALTCEVVVIDK